MDKQGGDASMKIKSDTNTIQTTAGLCIDTFDIFTLLGVNDCNAFSPLKPQPKKEYPLQKGYAFFRKRENLCYLPTILDLLLSPIINLISIYNFLMFISDFFKLNSCK